MPTDGMVGGDKVEQIDTGLISFAFALFAFVAAWIISPLVKNSSRLATIESKQNTNCELIAFHGKEIASMKEGHTQELSSIKEAYTRDLNEIKAKQSWQETAEYIMGALTKAVEGLQGTVMGWDGKLTGILIQITQIMGDVKVAKEAADRANDRIDNIEGSTRAKEVVSSSGR